MKLWVDGQCFQSLSRNRGIGRYAFELLQAITAEHPEVELHISLNAAMHEQAISARNELAAIVPKNQIHMWHGLEKDGEAVAGYTADRRFSEIALTHHVNCVAPDAALSLSPFEGMDDAVVPLLPSAALQVPALAIFYDAIPMRFRSKYLKHKVARGAYDRRMKECRKFDSLLCISEFAVGEAKELVGSSRGINISAGVSRDFELLLDGPSNGTQISDRKFLLYVGALDWRKNVSVIPKAIALLPAETAAQFDLVLAGDHPEELLNTIVKQWRELGLAPGRLKPIGHVSDRQLVELYQTASAVIQPSFMEGFGLTALEALMCGTPVLAARAGAIPEVVKFDELLFDPGSPTELAAKIAQVFANSAISRMAEKRRVEVSKLFTWSNTASAALGELKRLASRKAPNEDYSSLRLLIKKEVEKFSGDKAILAKTLTLAECVEPAEGRIIVDATNTIRSDYTTGIQRVVRQICQNLVNKSPHQGQEIVISHSIDESGRYTADNDLTAVPETLPHRKMTPGENDTVLMLDSSWNMISVHRNFLFESRLRGAEVISCLYDMVPLKTSAFCHEGMPPVFRDWLVSALETSTGFVCISKAVADELFSLLSDIEYPHRMKVGYWRLGADFSHLDSVNHTSSKLKNIQPSFLMVGTLEPRKGHHVALDAFERGWATGFDAHLTIVGKYGWNAESLADRIKNHPEYGKRLHWHDAVEDEELTRLYSQCDALIAASYSEGFGLPIVEAGRFGVPIIASDIPVFREVAEGAPFAHFFETGSPDSLLEELQLFARGSNVSSIGAKTSASSWPNWSESTDELLQVIADDNWYKVYEPATPHRFQMPSSVGRLKHSAPIAPIDQSHALRILPGLASTLEDGSRRLSIAVTNLSKQAWFGRGLDDGRYGVALSYVLLDKYGRVVCRENPRSPIVMALQPGDTNILPLTISPDWVRKGAAAAEVQLVQEGVMWWGKPLRIELGDASTSASPALAVKS